MNRRAGCERRNRDVINVIHQELVTQLTERFYRMGYIVARSFFLFFDKKLGQLLMAEIGNSERS